ncbi:glycosyltransferase family 39 protein [Antarcticirhabdus aurantiaca]|uniref:Glycosyltransferase family 39 protein n=1 Tax=Antarcticirhabdus aurantiaca TaxID=2606717 RepID=A0ACD4NW67_9HYPH|nr:glycosyltransferase family 39 protein [Antarcticirhabdus aurantiaca]WAJ30926.1 glycosyltransferase family 39 protein [Jeongeuplla avenae]
MRPSDPTRSAERRNRLSDGFDALAGWATRRIVGIPASLLFVAAVFALNLVLNIEDGTVGYDDREQLQHMTRWAWGYSGVQPPLHTWIVKSMVPIFGDGIDAIYAARFLVLLLVFIAMYAAAKLMRLTPEGTAAAVLGLFLLPQIGWEAQRSFSHSLTGLLGAVASLAALLWVVRDGRRIAYAALGLAAAVALLGKYNGAILLLGLAAGTLSAGPLTRAIRPRRLLVSLGVFLAAIAGPALWLSGRIGTLDDSAHKFKAGDTSSPILDRLAGMGSLSLAIGAYSGLLVGLVLLALPAGGRLQALQGAARRVSEQAKVRLVFVAILVGLVLLAVGLLVGGATNVETYWLHPLLVFTPLAAAAAFDGLPAGSRVHRATIGSAVLAAIVTVLAFVLRTLDLA